jgi:hypothetical protein
MKHIRQTSIEVYRQMEREGLLSERRWEAYKILYEYGPMTSNEIFEKARLHGNPNYRHNTNARMTELRDLGVAVEVGTRECSVTGRTVILWDVTDQLPSRPEKREATPSKKDRRAAADELRGLYTLAEKHGKPFSDNLVRVCKWLKS